MRDEVAEPVTGESVWLVDADEFAEVTGKSDRRGRVALAAVLLLLLLLCAATMIGGTVVERGDDTVIRGVTDNLGCLQCHPEVIPDFYRQVVHDPFRRELCTACHTPHGRVEHETILAGLVAEVSRVRTLVEWLPLKLVLDVFSTGEVTTIVDPGGDVKSSTDTTVGPRGSALVAEPPDLCWMCHVELTRELSYEHTHEPFVRGFCLSCHHPHSSDHDAIARAEPRDLCVGCHAIAGELGMPVVHAPFGRRECLACHGPHATRFTGMIVKRQRDLCFSCHPQIAQLGSKGFQHHPFTYDQCTSCHGYHASRARRLLRQDEPALCYTCHPEIRADFRLASHHPVGTLLRCSSCHGPHATDYPGLLFAENNEICYRCHRVPIQATYDRSRHVDQPCWRCHTPHGSMYRPLLVMNQPELCFRCHERIGYDDRHGGYYNHPVRSSFYDPVARRGLTCTSTCHNPHGTIHNYMLRHYRAPTDGNCLICHQPKYGMDPS